MSKKRVLIVTQEMQPYTELNEISEIARKLPQLYQSNNLEVRVLMPRFGTINERRHRLHEVVRLSGTNIIVDDDDYPLIIKVASLPGARMQVYFLDNEDFFKRKFMLEDAEGKGFEDNANRMIFFCKSVIETVKRFGWPPDVIHCHGWMTSLIPSYLKDAYSNEPLFNKTKLVYSAYDSPHESSFNADSFIETALTRNLEEKDLDIFKDANGNINLNKGAMLRSDAIILASDQVNEDAKNTFESMDAPKLDANQDIEDKLPLYWEFFEPLVAEEQEAE
ncbi:MAG: glycogen/starch synthase [Saprospiraceae bacterium]|nr:glycogen/starch synthase [Saprospiraceae bacterium]